MDQNMMDLLMGMQTVDIVPLLPTTAKFNFGMLTNCVNFKYLSTYLAHTLCTYTYNHI